MPIDLNFLYIIILIKSVYLHAHLVTTRMDVKLIKIKRKKNILRPAVLPEFAKIKLLFVAKL